MPGFTSPSILFLSTWDKPERDYLYRLSKKLRKSGSYDRIVEPCVGAFALPKVHLAAGWSAEQIETSDVWLFSAVIGSIVSGTDLEELAVAVDGAPLPLTGDPLADGAEILYQQLRLRMERRSGTDYFGDIVEDLGQRKPEHLAVLRSKLDANRLAFTGCRFRSSDPWGHLEAVADDPRTIVTMNPPTYKGAYEKFFDTDGRLTWAAPSYTVWDGAVDQYRLAAAAAGWKALVLCQQQAKKGHAAAKTVVHARDLSRDELVVIWTNRPETVRGHVGLSAIPRKPVEMEPLGVRQISTSSHPEAGEELALVRIKGKNAAYYKELWIHKLDPRPATADVAVLLDGELVGLLGYSDQAIRQPFRMRDALILFYSVGAPHDARLTRLVTMVACTRTAAEVAMDPWVLALTRRLVTVEYSPYPEAKGLRGIMKLQERTPDPRFGQRLVYGTDLLDRSLAETLEEWKRRETQWRKHRQPAG